MWYKIKGHENYEITKNGKVRKTDSKRIKSIYFNDRGYKMVSINIDGKSKPRRLHRMLALTFIENPNNLPHINHIDGNKLNNDLSNLEWCDIMHNNRHGFKLGLINNTGENNGMAKLREHQVKEIKKLLSDGKLSQYKIAAKFGVSRSCIMNIKNRGQWGHITI